MGHKVHPYGFRLGVSRTWSAKWYADKDDYTTLLKEDIAIRRLIDRRLANASVGHVEIEIPPSVNCCAPTLAVFVMLNPPAFMSL